MEWADSRDAGEGGGAAGGERFSLLFAGEEGVVIGRRDEFVPVVLEATELGGLGNSQAAMWRGLGSVPAVVELEGPGEWGYTFFGTAPVLRGLLMGWEGMDGYVTKLAPVGRALPLSTTS